MITPTEIYLSKITEKYISFIKRVSATNVFREIMNVKKILTNRVFPSKFGHHQNMENSQKFRIFPEF